MEALGPEFVDAVPGSLALQPINNFPGQYALVRLPTQAPCAAAGESLIIFLVGVLW